MTEFLLRLRRLSRKGCRILLAGTVLIAASLSAPAAASAQAVAALGRSAAGPFHTTLADGSLPRSTPEAQGVSAEGIRAFLEAVDAKMQEPNSGVELHSLMVIRNSHVIVEGWWDPYKPEYKHMLFSLSKSFTSTAVGLAIQEGRIGLDDRVSSFFPEELPDAVGENLAAMRIRDLLTMSTGQDGIAQILEGTDDWIKGFLAYPVTYKPGTHFYYNTMASFMLSAIVQKVTGQTVLQYLTPRLFDPIGIRDITWDSNPQGINVGGAGLNVRTEDIARFGLLYLQNGAWNGKSVVPAGWVKEATTAHIASSSGASQHEPAENDWAQGYGYQFWRTTHDAYRGDGAFGQFAIILPAMNTVIATTSGSNNMQGVLDLIWQYLLPAFEEAPLPQSEQADARLEARLASLTLLPERRSVSSTAALRVSGKTYRLDTNALHLRALSYRFDPSSCTLTLTTDRGTHRISCGIGTWKQRQNSTPLAPRSTLLGLPVSTSNVAVAGSWADDSTFVLTIQMVETPFHDTLTSHFEGNEVRVEFARMVGNISLGRDERPTLHGRIAP